MLSVIKSTSQHTSDLSIPKSFSILRLALEAGLKSQPPNKRGN